MNICSFFAPRPEHPFFQDYTPFLALLRESCERFRHRHIVLTDDSTVGDDAYRVDLPRSLMRATLAAQLAYLSDPAFANTPTLLTGADCVLANDPAAVGFASHDLTITVDDRFADCRMNCGAIFVPRPHRVVTIWRNALARCGDDWGDDQTSLYAAIDDARHDWLTVREIPCDPYNLAPNDPGDDCRRGTVLHFRGPRKAWMVDYCHKWLRLGEGVTATALPNADEADTLANVRANSGRDLPWVHAREPHEHHAVLVGGGPSLIDSLPEIAERQKNGQIVFALNGTARFLIDRDITPDFGVMLDSRPNNARFVTPGVRWLLASQCHPDVFDATEKPIVWHFAADGALDALGRGDAMMIGGGITIGLTVMGLVFAMGYRNIHLYGYDSSDRDDAAHAYIQKQDAPEKKRVTVWCGGRFFTSGIAMYAQANAFEAWANLLADQGATITVHGDGLLPTIAREMQRAAAMEFAA